MSPPIPHHWTISLGDFALIESEVCSDCTPGLGIYIGALRKERGWPREGASSAYPKFKFRIVLSPFESQEVKKYGRMTRSRKR